MVSNDGFDRGTDLTETEAQFVASRRRLLRYADREVLSEVASEYGTADPATGSATGGNPDGGAGMSRRRLLQAVGLGSATVLAGCSGDEPEDPGQAGDDETPGSGTSGAPVFSTTTFTTDPSRMNYNAYSTAVQAGDQGTTHWSYTTHTVGNRLDGPLDDEGEVIHQGEVEELLEWEMVEPDLAHVTIRDEFSDLEWFNGKPVTAEDVRAKFVLEKLADNRNQDKAESYEVIDDDTLAVQMAGPINEVSFFHTLAPIPINTRADIYEEWVEWAVDSDYDEEVLEDLMELQVEEPIGHGPWRIVDTTADKIFFELNEDHPQADQFNWTELELVFTPEVDVQWQRVVTGNTTAEIGRIPESIIEQVGEEFRWYHAPLRSGMTVHYHYDLFPEREARKAMAYLLDAETIALNSGLPLDIAIILWDWQTGLFQGEEGHRELLGDDLVDSLEDYGHDEERALELFQQAGYEHDGSTLYHPGGDEPVQMDVMAPTFLPTYIPRAETIVDRAGEFGIDASMSVQETGGFFTATATGDYDATTYWTGGYSYEPSANFTFNWIPGRIDRPLEHGADLENYPVPMPIGDPDGAIEEINVRQYVEDLESHREEDRREAMRVLAWAQNQNLHHYIMTDGVDTLLLDESNWVGPEPEEPMAGTASVSTYARRSIVDARTDD